MEECYHTVVFYTFLISVSLMQKKKKKTCRKQRSKHAKRMFCVPFGHKREVASYRDRSQAMGSKAHRGDTGDINISLLSIALLN